MKYESVSNVSKPDRSAKAETRTENLASRQAMRWQPPSYDLHYCNVVFCKAYISLTRNLQTDFGRTNWTDLAEGKANDGKTSEDRTGMCLIPGVQNRDLMLPYRPAYYLQHR